MTPRRSAGVSERTALLRFRVFSVRIACTSFPKFASDDRILLALVRTGALTVPGIGALNDPGPTHGAVESAYADGAPERGDGTGLQRAKSSGRRNFLPSRGLPLASGARSGKIGSVDTVSFEVPDPPDKQRKVPWH